MKIILLNGPPRSGKTTSARIIQQLQPDSAVIGFSFHLKRFVHTIYLGEHGATLDPDVFDSIKGAPQDLLSGMSWRQAYIHYSENVIKPLHGNRWFGEQWIKAVETSGKDVILVPDSGFQAEAEAVIDRFGADAVALFRLHRDGRDFTGDSRSYITLDGVQTFDITPGQDDWENDLRDFYTTYPL